MNKQELIEKLEVLNKEIYNLIIDIDTKLYILARINMVILDLKKLDEPTKAEPPFRLDEKDLESPLFREQTDIAKVEDVVAKPPIGIIPRDIHERNVRVNRINDLMETIERYKNNGLEVKEAWVTELYELIDAHVKV